MRGSIDVALELLGVSAITNGCNTMSDRQTAMSTIEKLRRQIILSDYSELKEMTDAEKEDFRRRFGPAVAAIGDFVIYERSDARDLWERSR